MKRYVRNLCFGKSTIYKQIKNLKLVSKLADIQVFFINFAFETVISETAVSKIT